MRRLRIDARLAVAAVLSVTAGAIVHAATRPEPRIAVLVAESALPAGVPLADLTLATRMVDPLPGLVAAFREPDYADHTLAAPLAAGEPLLASLLVAPPSERPDVVALTLEPAHAVQGDLVAGDLVDVYVSREGETLLLAAGVAVLAAETGAGGLGGTDTALLLAVDAVLARDLIEAERTASLDLVRRAR